MAKILFISNIAKRVGSFSIASIAAAKKCGLEFYYAANWQAATDEQREEDEKKFGVKLVNIDLDRSPYALKNIHAYKQLIHFIEEEQIDYIHCNTPVGGLLGRLAGKKCKVKKVIYQAHGFHFFNGAPAKNWLLYYPIEKKLAKLTDAIITINQEDFERAQKFKCRRDKSIYYVPGVGLDLSQYSLVVSSRVEKRTELGLRDSDIALISMGDLIDRKNYPLAIGAVADTKNPKLHYYICGQGPDENKLKNLAKTLKIENQIHFLGYRTDIKELLKAADIFIFSSKQEGLARSLMEAMASGLPCIASNIRGNTDLLYSAGGYLCSTIDEYVDAISKLAGDEDLRIDFGEKNVNLIQNFGIDLVIDSLYKIYCEVFR